MLQFNPYTYLYNRNLTPQIGTAWFGRHIVIIHCNPQTNQFLKIDKSLHAPIEPPHENCAETIAQLYSIGYQLEGIAPISNNEIIYIFKK